jgi:hypothetical protein
MSFSISKESRISNQIYIINETEYLWIDDCWFCSHKIDVKNCKDDDCILKRKKIYLRLKYQYFPLKIIVTIPNASINNKIDGQHYIHENKHKIWKDNNWFCKHNLDILKCIKCINKYSTEASTKRVVANLDLYESKDINAWENNYSEILDLKYQKNTRNYNKNITVDKWDGEEVPIYLIPRERGGPSYKSNKLEGIDSNNVQYCAISKGYGMQDVSSFTLGPIVGEGLCLVNASFSKIVCIKHIEGGGIVDLKRKYFWKSGKAERDIKIIDKNNMFVDNEKFKINEWLEINKDLWFDEWYKWSKSIALCSMGNFHWGSDSETVTFYCHGRYLSFVDWKKECYIKPSIKMLTNIDAYKHLEMLYKNKIPLGLVHPMAITGQTEKVITRQFLKSKIESKNELCCQPIVIASKLLNVEI